MAKSQTPPAGQQGVDTQASRVNETADKTAPGRNTGHPLLKTDSKTQEFLDARANKLAHDELIIERIGEWKECVNRIAAAPDGQHLLKMMIKHCGLFASKKGQDAARLLRTEAMQAFYLDYIRPYLEPEQRQAIE